MTTTSRKDIRAAVKAAILHCVTFAGEKVFTSRSIKIDDGEYPVILIYTPDEKTSIFSASPRIYKRVCTLKMDISTQGVVDDDGNDTVEDDLDDYAALVEQCLVDHDTLGGIVDWIDLVSTETEINSEGAKIVGGIVLSFDVTYYTEPEQSENHSDMTPFETAQTTYKQPQSLTDSPNASDTVMLDQ